MGQDLAVPVVRRPHEGGTARGAAEGPSSKPHLALADEKVWTHTLVLTGELDGRSARTLEAEIEHLCAQGVSGITLDLRGLTYIDWIGVAVIAFRCDHCKRSGYEFALIPGSPAIQRAFEQTGLGDELPFRDSTTESSPVVDDQGQPAMHTA